jgi:hypothetical protein
MQAADRILLVAEARQAANPALLVPPPGGSAGGGDDGSAGKRGGMLAGQPSAALSPASAVLAI